jgi:hypothetical protein
MQAVPIPIEWSTRLPVFASEEFLRSVGDEYGWLGGVDSAGKVHCILPYTVIRKAGFSMVRLRVETISLGPAVDISEEKAFLNSAIGYFRSLADVIIPATTNAIFRTYPDGADAAPYGTYIIDLKQPEEVLWKAIGRITRQNIGTAKKDGVRIENGMEYLEPAYKLIKETFERSKLPFMDYKSLQRYMSGLGDHGKLVVAEYQGTIESCVIYAFSAYCAYAVYAGNVARQHQGANKLIYWEAFRLFQQLGVERFDFVGARIDPAKGSKQEAINLFKQRMGARLTRGFIWKYPLRPWKSLVYSAAVRFLRGGDIVDRERHKMTLVTDSAASVAAPCKA